MDKNQSLEAIVQALDLAVRKGVYSMEDVKIILQSIDCIKSLIESSKEDG